MPHTSGAHSSPSPQPWSYNEDADRLGAATILVVEDDRDIRQMLATLLDIAGFDTVTCDTAEAGLAALREREFDVVLTDYALPERTGVWLLHEAAEAGLIENTPVFIVTAHPHVEGGDGYEIIQKPFDLDELVERLRKRMDSERRPARRASDGKSSTGDGEGGDGEDDCPDPIELILYVSSNSPRSASAVRNIEAVLSRFSSTRVKLTVCDLAENPNGGAQDSVAFTPTLVRRSPGPRTFILGHITSPELLLELLGECAE